MSVVHIVAEEKEDGTFEVHSAYAVFNAAVQAALALCPITPDMADKELTRRDNLEGRRHKLLRQNAVLRTYEGMARMEIDADLWEPVDQANSHVVGLVKSRAQILTREVQDG